MKDIEAQLVAYKAAVEIELHDLLNWWRTYTVDEKHGGFYGEVSNANKAILDQPKGIVLNSRILWTFSAAFLYKKEEVDFGIAKRAFDYILANFYDSENGGFYWSVNAQGEILAGKKQVYGQAFAIYGLAEYYKITGDEKVLELAKETYRLIEKYSFDPVNLGYIEAFNQNWETLADLRLSDKDLNAEKSMNTHLHIIEAYANLYLVWKDEDLAKAIKQLLFVFKEHMITKTNRLRLFFSANWQPKSDLISYGHDIEAAWLLQECAEILGDKEEIAAFKTLALNLTNSVNDGLDKDGGMYYENNPLVQEKHWWPQAEAMIGFFNAYQLTANDEFLLKSTRSWNFINSTLKDHKNGEWYWGIYPDGTVMDENKAGFWKCPYHNGRACLEILKRIQKINF